MSVIDRAQAAPASTSRRSRAAWSAPRPGKIRQAKKIDELKKALFALGYKPGGQFTAQALGLKHRSTVWAILNTKHGRGGLTNKTVKQLLAAKTMPCMDGARGAREKSGISANGVGCSHVYGL